MDESRWVAVRRAEVRGLRRKVAAAALGEARHLASQWKCVKVCVYSKAV